jgi:hypothetical protein
MLPDYQPGISKSRMRGLECRRYLVTLPAKGLFHRYRGMRPGQSLVGTSRKRGCMSPSQLGPYRQ